MSVEGEVIEAKGLQKRSPISKTGHTALTIGANVAENGPIETINSDPVETEEPSTL